MIIVEGPDGAGKTTLMEELRVELELPVAPRVVSKDAEALSDLKRWTEHNVQGGFQPTLFDRHRLISEPIYGSILRDRFEPGFDDPSWLYFMYYQFYRAKPLIIYCLPPYKNVRQNVIHDEDNKVVRDHIRKVYSLYVAQAASDAARGHLVWDYTNPMASGFDMILTTARKAVENGGHDV